MQSKLSLFFCLLIAAPGIALSQTAAAPKASPVPKLGQPSKAVQPILRRAGEIARPTGTEHAKWPDQSSPASNLPEQGTRDDAEARDLFLQASKFLKDGRPELALPLLSSLEKVEPKRFEVQYLLGVALAMNKRPDDAATAFQRATVLNPKSADAFSGLCQVLAVADRRIEAIDACREAVRLAPTKSRFKAQLAGMYLLDERSADAVALLQAQSRTEQNDLLFLGMLGDAYYANNEYAKAGTIYERIVQNWPTVSLAYLRLSGVYDLLERPTEAVAAAKKFAQLEPTLSVAHFNLGMVLQASGFFFESIDSLVKTVDLDPANGSAYLALSEGYATVGDKDNELGSLRHAYKYLPPTLALSYRLGRALSENGQAEEAVEPLERAFSISPHPEIMRSLGMAYVQARQFDKGVELIEKANELSPLPPGMAIDLSGVKKRNELLDRFDQIVETAQKNPNSFKAQYELQGVYLFKGMMKEAEKPGLEMLRLAPNDYRNYNGMAGYYDSTGQTEKAVEMTRKAIELNPHHVIYLSLTFQLQKLGRVDEALTAARRSVEIKPLVESNILVGDLWLKKGNRQEALKAFQAALLMSPNDLRPNFRLAWLYIRMGDKENALRQYQNLKAIAPDQVVSLAMALQASFRVYLL